MVIQTKSCISVIGGEFFDLLKPEEFVYDIDMIGYALANLCRYTGHVTRFYSVAEHCVHVSRIIKPKYAMEGLLHDASEAFVGDVSSPLKKLITELYTPIEEGIQKAISVQFNLTYPFPDDVHKADKQLYWSERKKIAPAIDALWNKQFRASRKCEPQGWSPERAHKEYVHRYHEILQEKELLNDGYAGLE